MSQTQASSSGERCSACGEPIRLPSYGDNRASTQVLNCDLCYVRWDIAVNTMNVMIKDGDARPADFRPGGSLAPVSLPQHA